MLATNGRDSRLVFIYGLAFVFIFSTLRLPPGHGSNGNVEQWINLTNQMFLGPPDMLFSYGPMYWLVGGVATPYSETTYWLSLAFISAVNALFWALVICLTRTVGSYFFLAIAFFFFFHAAVFPPSLFLWPFMTMVYVDRTTDTRAMSPVIYVSLGLAVALSFYIRFFYGLVALGTITAYFFSRFLSERKAEGSLRFFITLVAAYCIFGLVIFKDSASLFEYIVINKELSYGNSVDMTLNVKNSVSSFVAVAISVVALNLYLVLHRRRLLLVANFLVLIFLKLGFGRTDHYVAYFVIPMAVLALVTIFDGRRYGSTIFLTIMGSLYFLASYPSYPGGPSKNVLTPPVDFDVDYGSRMAATYPAFKIDENLLRLIGTSSIDVYPYQNEYTYANKLNYIHRPSFQNYMTLTPKLDAMNEAFYKSPMAPDFVLWTAGIVCRASDCNPFDSFDEKYSLNEDPLTSTAILANYHTVAVGKGKDSTPLMLLAKNTGASSFSEQHMGDAQFQFGKWYKVPHSTTGMVKLKPQLKLTLYGRLKNLLFRGDILKIKYRLASGEVKEYRLNILNAQNGILASPLLDNIHLSGPRVEHVMFETDSQHYFYRDFAGTWVNIPLLQVKERAVASLYDPVIGAPQHSSEQMVNCEGSIDTINGVPAGRPAAHTSMYLEVHGWLAAAARDGSLFDQTFIVITDELGHRRFARTRSERRDDVALAYSRPDIQDAGFKTLIDPAGFGDAVQLGLAGLKGQTLYVCRQFAIPTSLTN